MTTLVTKSVSVRLSTLLIAILGVALIIGIPVGIASFSFGFNKAQDQARFRRDSDPAPQVRGLCPPALQLSR